MQPHRHPILSPTVKPRQDSQKQISREQETVDLETAYKREYAFLEAQKRELNERLKRFKSSANQEEQELSQSVNSLERNSVDRSAKIDLLNSQLVEAERQESALDERNDALETTYSQATVTLENHGIKNPTSFHRHTRQRSSQSQLFIQASINFD